jgi:hypothetical protein
MKKLLTLCTLGLLTISAFGNPNAKAHDYRIHKHSPSPFDVLPLNSPINDTVAKFLLKTPKDFVVSQVMYKVRNASELIMKEKDFTPAKLVSGTQGMELHVPISNLNNGFYRLFVRVRTEEKAKFENNFHDHDYKNTYHDFVKFVVERSSEVPMPDLVQNNISVSGIDSDKDGIRDDVQIWINQTYKGNITLQQVVRQKARAIQLNLTKVNNKQESILATRKSLDANSCMYAVVGIDQKRILTNELSKRLFNTKERLEAEILMNSNFSGQMYDLPSPQVERTLCDF